MYLVYDVETNGLPTSHSEPANNFNCWPRISQLALALYDSKGRMIYEDAMYIKPDGWEMPDELVKKYGITTEFLHEKGVAISWALGVFQRMERDCQFRVAHNISFDSKVLRAEMIRAYTSQFAPKFESGKHCTMMAAAKHFSIKWPKLDALYKKLFNEGFDGAHNAIHDRNACARIFFKLQELGAFEKKEPEKQETAGDLGL